MTLLRRISSLLVVVAALTLAACIKAPLARAQENGSFYLKNGDRVVFYGDSITDQRLYTTFIESYVVTRFPRLEVSFVHSGWGGDRVTGGGGGPIDVRLRRDVIAYKPTVMTIMLGMNDGGYRPFDQGLFDTYSKGYEHILDVVKGASPGLRVTLIEPSPFDDVTRSPKFEGGYNAVLVRYSQFVKELGEREHMLVVDMNAPLVDTLRCALKADPEGAQQILPDRIHPRPGGHLVMAEALLKGWNAPATVSSVEIDAPRHRVVEARNTHVTALKVNDGGLTWTETDDALPMPLSMSDPTVKLALECSDFVQALDQQPLKVTGLAAGRYALKIDGDTVGDFTQEQLGEGVNLATLPTPMEKQAADVHDLTLKHNNLHYARWRDLQVPLEDQPLPDLKKALDDLDKLEAEVIKEQRAEAQPKPRHVELARE